MIFRKSDDELVLRIGTTEHRFEHPADLEFALAGRTGLPAAKIAKLVILRDEALLQEAAAIREVESLLASALAGGLEDRAGVGRFLRTLDLAMVSNDHGWRDIVAGLNAIGTTHEPYKKVALVKYMQYLTARQDVIKSLYANRQVHRPAEKLSAKLSGDQLKETVIFDLTMLAAAKEEAESEAFARMPKGETVEIDMEPGVDVEVHLASNVCRFTVDEHLAFIDESGLRSPLRRGRNIIGRDATCDVVINAQLRDVSRRHLVVETDGERTVRLTDISSHGTSLPARHLESTSI